MTILQALLLGALQGVAEFLPISSSGHLAIVQNLFSLDSVPLLFNITLHVATLAAIAIFFHTQIWELLCAFGRMLSRRPIDTSYAGTSGLTQTDSVARKTVGAIMLASVATGVLGVVVKKLLPTLPIQCVFAGFIVTACTLIFSAYVSKKQHALPIAEDDDMQASNNDGISWKQALAVGTAQGIGTLPGVSRSGATIAGGLVGGMSRADAGEFSFIVSIPAILGAFILELKDVGKVAESIGVASVAVGCMAAFVVGYVSLMLLMKIIKKGKLAWFALYLIPLGILGLIFVK